jgi:hypothetical protein
MRPRRSFGVIMATLFLVLLLPVVGSAQFSDLDAAMTNLERGFGSGDVNAIVSGVPEGYKAQLQFHIPGLADQSGFFDRDQAAYLLDGPFKKVKPSGFELERVRRAEGKYQIAARWTINSGTVDLYIILQQKGEEWSLVSVRSA